MIRSGVYRHIGNGANLKRIRIRRGELYLIHQQGMQKWKGEWCIAVIITSYPVPHSQDKYLYSNKGTFDKNWKMLYE